MGPHIVVFSASEPVRRILQLHLSNHNLRVFERPKEAQAHIQANPKDIELVLTTYEHHTGGIQNEVLTPGRDILRAAKTHGVPVVGLGMEHEKRAVLENGASEFVKIPAKKADLIAAVQRNRISTEA